MTLKHILIGHTTYLENIIISKNKITSCNEIIIIRNISITNNDGFIKEEPKIYTRLDITNKYYQRIFSKTINLDVEIVEIVEILEIVEIYSLTNDKIFVTTNSLSFIWEYNY